MNFENTTLQVSNKFFSSKTLCVKGAALSLTLFLGACASTGDKVDTAAPAPAKEKAPKAEQQAAEPAPTAAELMKTLKAPLVEPPGQEKKVAQSAPVKVQTEKQIPKTQEKVMEAGAAVKAEAAKLDTVKVEATKVEAAKVEAAKAEAVVEAKAEKIATAPVQKKPEPVIVEAVKISPTGAQAFNVSASKLPFTYDIWTIREGNTPLTQGLVIATPTWEMGKEGYMSQIWLTLMEDKIHVNSSSDIETASKGLGIRIDGGDLIPFTSIAENNIGVISGKWLNKLALANKVDVYLGFFPGKKPTSDTFKSDLSLDNLARIVATYRALNQ